MRRVAAAAAAAAAAHRTHSAFLPVCLSPHASVMTASAARDAASTATAPTVPPPTPPADVPVPAVLAQRLLANGLIAHRGGGHRCAMMPAPRAAHARALVSPSALRKRAEEVSPFRTHAGAPQRNALKRHSTLPPHPALRSSAPENTLAAVRQAALDGAVAVEVDVQLTSDGVPLARPAPPACLPSHGASVGAARNPANAVPPRARFRSCTTPQSTARCLAAAPCAG